MEPVVKLTWAPLKDGLRLSAELWLTFSKSELLLFIFNRCLGKEQTMYVRTCGRHSVGFHGQTLLMGHRSPMLSKTAQHQEGIHRIIWREQEQGFL